MLKFEACVDIKKLDGRADGWMFDLRRSFTSSIFDQTMRLA